ncbi:MAG: histidine kinase dimerization/phospho-acceptor domain-containing protein, partial [Candidatus Binatia bacterium]
MRIARKLYAFVMVGLMLVLAFFGYFSFQREVVQFETDMKLDAHILGRAMSSTIYDVWRTSGQERALDLIKDANAKQSLISLRWVWLEGTADDAYRPQIALQELFPLTQGMEVSVRGETKEGVGALYTYVPVKTAEGRPGALELAEPLTRLDEYTRTSAQRLAIMAVVLVAVGGLLMSVMGHWVLGKRMRNLAMQARKIAGGDLASELELHGHDEIAELSREMNSMSRQLQESRDKLIRETNARIKTLEELRHTERLATLGRLSAGIAHELGTPLNVVVGRAKLIATEDMEKGEIVECSRIIGEQAKRMTESVRRLLDFARRRAPLKSQINMQEMTRQLLDMLSPIAKKHRITLELINNAGLPMVAVDRSQIQQVLTNLVMNGIQAMPNGGILEVELHLERARHLSQESGQEKE